MEFRFSLEYKSDGQIRRAEGVENELYALDIEEGEKTLNVVLQPKRELELVNAYLDFDFPYEITDKVFVNGYQSWTTSREFGKDDVQKGLMGLANRPPVKRYCCLFGDYDFQKYTKKKGVFHSYSYTYIKRAGKIILLGSTTEANGFTVFHHDMNAGKLSVQLDVEGVTTGESYPLHSLYRTEGAYEDAFDDYFAALRIAPPKYSRMKGYTSWYNYYGGISQKQLCRDLDGLATIGKSADIFQIDDGYQSAVGDWLTVKEKKFPDGMKYLVDKIHAYGYKAGLWLAPFNAQKSSRLVKNHPDWLVKDKKGGFELGNIGWGGAYTIDFYIPEAADYIRDVFKGILDDWGFDMVKLDFLYSVCRTPRHNKSRGRIMTEAMQFLRECVGDKILLGCGVPLFPAFGLADFCRISSDVGRRFKDPFYIKHTNQELFSTKSAMNNTVFRRHLDGRAFLNDPDVFYLRHNDLRGRDKLFLKSGVLKFTEEQKLLLARINSMCGNVLFVSDNVGGYDAEQKRMIKRIFSSERKAVTEADYIERDVVQIVYTDGGDSRRLTYNVKSGKSTEEKL